MMFATREIESRSAAGARQWAGLAVLVLSSMIVAMDGNVLAIALPHLGADLNASATQLLWIMDIYAFMVAGLLITMGALGDRIGRRRLLLIGAGTFAAASAIAAYSTSPGILIAARALLGVAGATLAPSTLSLIRNMFADPGQRRFAIGVWTACFGAGGVSGPLLGGFLLDRFWWGSVFLINVPVMALLLVLGPGLLPEFRNPPRGRLDLPSAALSLAAVLPVIFGVKSIAAHGPGWPAALAIVVGLFIGAMFLRRQRILPDPLLELRLFGDRRFVTALAVYLLVTFAASGFVVFMAQDLQLVIGLPAFETALWWVPAAVTMMAGALLASALARRTRPAHAVAAGLLLQTAGFVILALASVDGGPLIPVTGFSLQAAGLGVVSALAVDMMVATATPEHSGAASAVGETGQVFGGALGIAILGSIAAAVYRGHISGATPADLPPGAARSAHETLTEAAETAEHLPPGLGAALLGAARESFIAGMRLSAVIVVVATAAAAALTVTVLRHVRSEPSPDDLDGPSQDVGAQGSA
jgi:DHA2 family multidrug resistance protein-like MFS transporter